ncbi:hypothetical protein RQP46_008966 [Phenoliferia psychrophenolica]
MELLAHILHLATEGETAEEGQRARFAFGLVSRACFLATADATTFFVAGDTSAKALASKLEREKKWAAQEERKGKSGRTTRASLSTTRLTTVRRVSIVIDKRTTGKHIATLLRATPKLVALELDVADPPAYRDEWSRLALSNIAAALGGLSILKTLRIRSSAGQGYPKLEPDMSLGHLHRLVSPLTSLEVLDLDQSLWIDEFEGLESFPPLPLPHLRHLHLSSPLGLVALVSPPDGGLKSLHLGATSTYYISKDLDDLVPIISNLTSFTWSATAEQPLDGARRDTMLKLLGAMSSLEHITIPWWSLAASSEESKDPNIFQPLLMLPLLSTMTVVLPPNTPIEDAPTDDPMATYCLMSSPPHVRWTLPVPRPWAGLINQQVE